MPPVVAVARATTPWKAIPTPVPSVQVVATVTVVAVWVARVAGVSPATVQVGAVVSTEPVLAVKAWFPVVDANEFEPPPVLVRVTPAIDAGVD